MTMRAESTDKQELRWYRDTPASGGDEVTGPGTLQRRCGVRRRIRGLKLRVWEDEARIKRLGISGRNNDIQQAAADLQYHTLLHCNAQYYKQVDLGHKSSSNTRAP